MHTDQGAEGTERARGGLGSAGRRRRAKAAAEGSGRGRGAERPADVGDAVADDVLEQRRQQRQVVVPRVPEEGLHRNRILRLPHPPPGRAPPRPTRGRVKEGRGGRQQSGEGVGVGNLEEVALGGVVDEDGAAQVAVEARQVLDVHPLNRQRLLPAPPPPPPGVARSAPAHIAGPRRGGAERGDLPVEAVGDEVGRRRVELVDDGRRVGLRPSARRGETITESSERVSER